MKETIQSLGQEVAIVIYDAPLPPKYFRFSKKFIHTLFVVVPVIITLIFTALFVWGLAYRIKDTPAPNMQKVIGTDENKLKGLELELASLQQSNMEMANKLAALPAAAGSEDPYLMAIKKPYGMQNLLSQNKVSLDQFELVQDTNKVNFKFQIISSNPETRVAGHVIVFMVSEAGLMAYPKEANDNLIGGIKYSTGESFAMSRLRPTNAEFFHRLTGSTVKFIIYIFNREGDLLHIRETESFKVGAKS